VRRRTRDREGKIDGKKKRSNSDKSRAGRIKPVCGTDDVYNIIILDLQLYGWINNVIYETPEAQVEEFISWVVKFSR
jgi:hypothetical protein